MPSFHISRLLIIDVKELLKMFSLFGNHWQCENNVYLSLVYV